MYDDYCQYFTKKYYTNILITNSYFLHYEHLSKKYKYIPTSVFIALSAYQIKNSQKIIYCFSVLKNIGFIGISSKVNKNDLYPTKIIGYKTIKILRSQLSNVLNPFI